MVQYFRDIEPGVKFYEYNDGHKFEYLAHGEVEKTFGKLRRRCEEICVFDEDIDTTLDHETKQDLIDEMNDYIKHN